MSVIPLLSPFSHFEDLSKELLILECKFSDHLVDLDLVVSEVVICAIHAVVGLTIAFGLELTEEGRFHPGAAVAKARTIISLDESHVCGARQESLGGSRATIRVSQGHSLRCLRHAEYLVNR